MGIGAEEASKNGLMVPSTSENGHSTKPTDMEN